MLLLVVVLALACAVLGLYLLFLMQEITRISDTVEAVTSTDTNGEIYTLTSNKSMKRLAARINAMLAEYRYKNKKVRKADASFKESVTNISHDLRTPLTSVSGYLQLLKSEKTPLEKKTEYLEIIEKRLGALLVLLDELFEYTRLESSAMALESEKINLPGVLLEQLALYYEEFALRQITPQVEVPAQPVFAFCDGKNLERVFQNLIKNMLVHGANSFLVSFSSYGEYGEVLFRNGLAHPLEDPERLFDRFYIGDKSRSGQTTGLGLAIVRQLAVAMGGSVRADQLDGNLRIFVRFPLIQ